MASVACVKSVVLSLLQVLLLPPNFPSFVGSQKKKEDSLVPTPCSQLTPEGREKRKTQASLVNFAFSLICHSG